MLFGLTLCNFRIEPNTCMTSPKLPLDVLVVEDNPGDYLLIQTHLEEHFNQLSITGVETFKTAIEALASKEFDIILLDLSLPDNSGEALIKGMVDKAGQTPIIVLTGYSDLEFGVQSLSLGADDYLLKDELQDSLLQKSILYSMERKRINASLRESKNRYSKLFHLSPLPMLVYDFDTLQILEINQAALDHYGYNEREFLGMTIEQMRPTDMVPILHQQLRSVGMSESQFFRGLSKHMRKDGSVIDVEVVANRISEAGRNEQLVIAIDVTDKLKHLKAIEERNSKLSQIAWVQSHELRGPLARMMGLIESMNEVREAGMNEATFYTNIQQAAKELDTVITEIVRQAQDLEDDA